MKNFGRLMLLTLGLGLFAVVLSSVPTQPAAGAGGAPVFVQNTPLPVTGTVAAQQSGAWSVGINNFPTTVGVNNFPSSIGVSGGPVAVSNALDVASNPIPLLVRDADNPARQPFTATCTLAPNTSFATAGLVENCGSSAGGTPRVPANKRLVLEYVSVDTDFIPGSLARVQVQFISGGNKTPCQLHSQQWGPVGPSRNIRCIHGE